MARLSAASASSVAGWSARCGATRSSGSEASETIGAVLLRVSAELFMGTTEIAHDGHLVGRHQRGGMAHAGEFVQAGSRAALGHGLGGGGRQQIGLRAAQQQRGAGMRS
jgi:hypothetical protein